MTPKENVLAVWKRASDADVVAGRLWYRSAREIAYNLAVQFDLKDSNGNPDYRKVAGIIAALSPQQGWKVNLQNAVRVLSTRKFTGHTRANMAKVRAIYNGASPESVLGGHKVRSFYENIVNGGEGNNPTIDRHALSICLGRESSEEEQKYLSNRVSLQRECKNAYRVAAILIGLSPVEVQAITWVTWRREKGITD